MPDCGVNIRIRDDLALVSMVAARNAVATVAEQMMSRYRITLRDGPVLDSGEDLDVLGIGAGRWMLVGYAPARTFAAGVVHALSGLAALCDQSDSVAVFEVSGSDARRALAKGVSVDLHPSAFTTDSVAITNVAHVNAMIWQLPRLGESAGPSADSEEGAPVPDPRYCLAVPRSYGASFLEFLASSASEFGCDIVGAGRATRPP